MKFIAEYNGKKKEIEAVSKYYALHKAILAFNPPFAFVGRVSVKEAE